MFKTFSYLFSLKCLLKKSKVDVFLPYYHVVSDKNIEHIYHLYKYRNILHFIGDINFFKENFNFVSLHEILAYKRGEIKLPKNALHLSFDDGLQEIASFVAPLLKEHNIPATFFVTANFVDNKEMFYKFKQSLLLEEIKYHPETEITESDIREINYLNRNELDKFAKEMNYSFEKYLEERKPFLTSQQIEELIKMGFSIGAHSIDHPRFKEVDKEEQIRQILASTKKIKEKFNLEYSVFAFPFEDNYVSSEVFAAIEGKVDLTFGTSGLNEDIYNFSMQRFEMEKTQDPAEQIFREKCLKHIIKRYLGKHKLVRE
ncbi:MAG: polysaccharide deacetylase family protein [Bacteroidales bacterium]|nr:polysaccharide deacetylase family protein [Bacteroidales bacterium]